MVVVEGTESFELAADGMEGDVTTHDIDDVVGVFNLPGQGFPVRCQGAPAQGKEKDKEAKPGDIQNSSLARRVPCRFPIEYSGRQTATASREKHGASGARTDAGIPANKLIRPSWAFFRKICSRKLKPAVWFRGLFPQTNSAG
jgi:hypothetical protein